MDSRAEEELYQHLVALGYPEASIVYQPGLLPIGAVRYRPDFALIDPATKDVLAVIELKGGHGLAHIDEVAKHLRSYAAALHRGATQSFVATPSERGAGFDFFTLDESGRFKQVPSSFLQFGALRSGRGAVNKEVQAEAIARVTDHFEVVCFILALVGIAVVAADFVCAQFGIVLLTSYRMIVLGAVAALVVAPYLQKFRGLGIEFERPSKHPKG